MVGLLVTAIIATGTITAGGALDADVRAVAALKGEPSSVSAAGVTRSDNSILTIENGSTFEDTPALRLVIIGGLDGDPESARAVLNAVRWFKTRAPAAIRRRWALSALPLVDPDGNAAAKPFQFPPVKGFFDDPEQPESRYVWRWLVYQAPDLVIDMRARPPRYESSLRAAMAAEGSNEPGTVPVRLVTATGADGAAALGRALADASGLGRSSLHAALLNRCAREPVAVAGTLARRYPETPAISYISAVSWINALRLVSATGDDSLRARVRLQLRPWLSAEKPLFGNQIPLTAVAGTIIFAEFAAAARKPQQGAPAAGDVDVPLRLALQGAALAEERKPDGLAAHGQGWTDDMFMTAAVLFRSASLPGRQSDADSAARLLIHYATRLQRPDGVFVHAADAPVAWGRGNGFAALGLMEALTMLPPGSGPRNALLDIYRRQMVALRAAQTPDGMWRQVVDEPGAYREESATAMLLSAMARGIRLGWIGTEYVDAVRRAWRALLAHITLDGTPVDVCTGTGAGSTRRYYLDRPAINGADDRGGAMALLAAMEVYELDRLALRRPASRRSEGNASTARTVR